MLLGRMFWTDKGPKYLVMLIILSLVIYMFATLLGSTNIAEDIGISSKVYVICKVEKTLKDGQDSIPSPSLSVRIKIMGGKFLPYYLK